MSASPETEAHSPVELRKAMLILGSDLRSSVLPDSVLVWNSRSTPPPSCDTVGGQLWITVDDRHCEERGQDGRTLAANAMHLDVRRPLLAIRVVIMPNLHDSIKLTRSSIFSLRSGSVRFVAL